MPRSMKPLSFNQKLWLGSFLFAAIPAIFFILGMSGIGGGTLAEFMFEGGWNGNGYFSWYIIPGMFFALPFALLTQLFGASDSFGTGVLFYFAPVFSAVVFACCIRLVLFGIQKISNKHP